MPNARPGGPGGEIDPFGNRIPRKSPSPNPFLEFLEQEPQAGYQAKLGNQGSTNFLDYWRSQYGNVYNQYLGNLGKQATAGLAPTMSWTDFLKQFSFQNEWDKLAPWSKGYQRPQRGIWNLPY